MKKRILHVLRNLKYGGNQVLVYNLARYSSTQFTHTVVCFQKDLEMREEFESLGCDVEILPIGKNSFSIFKKRFKNFILNGGYDTVVTWFYPYILRLEFDGVRFVHHIGSATTFSPFAKWLKSVILTNSYKNSLGYFIFASHYVCNQHKKLLGVAFRESEVIHNGIDTDRFKPKPFGILKNSFVITMVGRLDKSKDFDTLIKIAPLLSKRIANVKINIVGDGPDKYRLQRLIKKFRVSDTINFLGRRSDVQAILADSDLFVFLNKPIEGFGLALVEAMSCGLPVVGYNLGANPEIVDDGINGFLVKDEKELVGRISLIAGSEMLAKRLGENAFRKAKEAFDVRVMVRKYEQTY